MQALAERRRHADNDPIVWTNQHFVQWARSIDLGEYSENLKGARTIYIFGNFSELRWRKIIQFQEVECMEQYVC